MHLLPREIDKLHLHAAGALAQKRLARGLRLNAPEVEALIASVIVERIRDGEMSVADLMDHGRTLIGTRQVLGGVAGLVPSVAVEGTFNDGTKLVSIHHPVAAEDGNLKDALYGSFLPVPELSVFDADSEKGLPEPGEMMIESGQITLNEGRKTVTLEVTHIGDRPIQVGSHYPFIEVNRYLKFDREKGYGHRLDIPAGTAVRFEPGESKTVTLVPIAGDQRLYGGNGLGTGPVNDYYRKGAMERVKKRGFAHVESK